jgi:hypothetical protein
MPWSLLIPGKGRKSILFQLVGFPEGLLEGRPAGRRTPGGQAGLFAAKKLEIPCFPLLCSPPQLLAVLFV